MPTYEVDVGGATYEVDAPDENTAWRWANASVSQNGSSDAERLVASSTAQGGFRGSAAGGFVQGARDLIDGGAQLLYNALPTSVQQAGDAANNWIAEKTGAVGEIPERNLSSLVTGATAGLNAKIANDERAYQDARSASGRGGFDAARLSGNVAGSMLIPGSRLASAPQSLLGRTAASAVQGGLLSALQPVTEGDFWSEKAKQVGTGAVASGVASPLLAGLARVIRPNTSQQVKTLMQEGVTPTPGQILGGRWQALEDRMTSIPGLGDAINSARERGLDQFNKAAYSRAVAGIADTPDDVGRAGVQAVKDALGSSYDDILSRTQFVADDAFNANVQRLQQLAGELPEKEAAQFSKILEKEVFGQMSPGGGMMGEVVKRVESQLGKEAKRFGRSSDAYQQKLGEAIRETQQILRDTIARQNPQVADELARTNAGYANYARIRDAASRSGTDSGKFTPAQLAAAVRAGDWSVGKGATATGTAFMQDLTDAGKSVLANKYPDSGTIGRGLLAGGLLTGGAAVEPMTLAAALLAAAPYAPVLDRATASLLTARPAGAKQLAEVVRKSAPLLGLGVGSALQQKP